MTAERSAAEDGGLSWKALKDAWYPPEAARPYRVLTCVSKSVEAALALAGAADAVVSIVTKTPTNLRLMIGGVAGAGTLSFNAALDYYVTMGNRERAAKQK